LTKVKPVANIPHLLDKSVPQILINRESLNHLNFDVELLGDCDIIINEIILRLNDQYQNFSSSAIINSKRNDLNWSDIIVNEEKSFKFLDKIEDENVENLFLNELENQQFYGEESTGILKDTLKDQNETKINESRLKYASNYLIKN
jgi:hypothetical protein